MCACITAAVLCSVVMGRTIIDHVDESSRSVIDADSEETKEVFQMTDVDGDGVLSYDEFKMKYEEALNSGSENTDPANSASSYVAVSSDGVIKADKEAPTKTAPIKPAPPPPAKPAPPEQGSGDACAGLPLCAWCKCANLCDNEHHAGCQSCMC